MLRTLQSRVCGSLRVQLSRRMVSRTTEASTDAAALQDDTEGQTDFRVRAERCLNRVTLIGRVGRDPEQRGNAEHPCLIFPLATNTIFRKSDGDRMIKTDWHRIAVFRPNLRDNIGQKISKGMSFHIEIVAVFSSSVPIAWRDRLLVEGVLSYTKYTDKEDRPVTSVSINAEEIMFLQKRRDANPTEED